MKYIKREGELKKILTEYHPSEINWEEVSRDIPFKWVTKYWYYIDKEIILQRLETQKLYEKYFDLWKKLILELGKVYDLGNYNKKFLDLLLLQFHTELKQSIKEERYPKYWNTDFGLFWINYPWWDQYFDKKYIFYQLANPNVWNQLDIDLIFSKFYKNQKIKKEEFFKSILNYEMSILNLFIKNAFFSFEYVILFMKIILKSDLSDKDKKTLIQNLYQKYKGNFNQKSIFLNLFDWIKYILKFKYFTRYKNLYRFLKGE
jgi:hypothetical protein